jgi:hypothetical protein
MTYLPSYFGLDNIKINLAYTPPLDTVASALAAYSVRKLRTAYTGFCMRVKRTSDNTTQDFGFGVYGLVNTSAILSFCGTGDGIVTIWYDQSGNARNLFENAYPSFGYIVRAGVLQTRNGIVTVNFNNTTSGSASLTTNIFTGFTTGYTSLNVLDSSNYDHNLGVNKVNTVAVGGCGPSLYFSQPNPWLQTKDFLQASVTSSTSTQIGLKDAPGLQNGLMYATSNLVVNAAGDMYSSNYNRIQKFNSAGTFLLKFGSYGTGNGQFAQFAMRQLGADSSGNIYVPDSTLNRVQKFDSSGNYVSQFGSTGTANGQFNSPVSVAVDSAGNIYVVDNN